MNISPRQLKSQLLRVKSRGWWRHLVDAAAFVFPAMEFDAFDLFAIGSRETNWNPLYLKVPGDGGNGFGPMQIDKRSFPEWVESGKWKDPSSAILMGAVVLHQKLEDAIAKQGAMIVVRSGGHSYSVVGKTLTPAEQKRVAIAAYNSGRWAHYHISMGRDPDHGTTGKDYSADVLERAETARAA